MTSCLSCNSLCFPMWSICLNVSGLLRPSLLLSSCFLFAKTLYFEVNVSGLLRLYFKVNVSGLLKLYQYFKVNVSGLLKLSLL